MVWNDTYEVWWGIYCFFKRTPDKIGDFTFMFTTDKYGAFRITDNPKIYKGYQNVGLSLEEASEYDIISYSNSIDEKKLKIINEIYLNEYW